MCSGTWLLHQLPHHAVTLWLFYLFVNGKMQEGFGQVSLTAFAFS